GQRGTARRSATTRGARCCRARARYPADRPRPTRDTRSTHRRRSYDRGRRRAPARVQTKRVARQAARLMSSCCSAVRQRLEFNTGASLRWSSRRGRLPFAALCWGASIERGRFVTSYFLRRLLLIVPTFIGVSLLVFALTRLVPGGPIERMLNEA